MPRLPCGIVRICVSFISSSSRWITIVLLQKVLHTIQYHLTILFLQQCQNEGAVPARADTAALALTLYELWLGASLLAKLRRDGTAFEHALKSTEQLLDMAPA